MSKSLIALAALAAMGHTVEAVAGETAPVALKNEDLAPPVLDVVTALEAIAADASHAADPREPAKRIAAVLAAYFRTPD